MNYLGIEYFGRVFGETVDYQSDVIVVVNEQSWRLGLWQGRHGVQRGVRAGAA